MCSFHDFIVSSFSLSDMAIMVYQVTFWLVLMLSILSWRLVILNTISSCSDTVYSYSTITQESSMPYSGVMKVGLVIDIAFLILDLVILLISLFYTRLLVSMSSSSLAMSTSSTECTFQRRVYIFKSPGSTARPLTNLYYLT